MKKLSRESYEKLVELFAHIELEANQAKRSLRKMRVDEKRFAPQQEHVDHARHSIGTCLRTINRLYGYDA